MAEEEAESGSTQCDGGAGVGPDPENGRGGVSEPLCEMAAEMLDEEWVGVLDCILGNIRERSLPSAKFLDDLAVLSQSPEGARQEEYESLAERLYAAYRGMEE